MRNAITATCTVCLKIYSMIAAFNLCLCLFAPLLSKPTQMESTTTTPWLFLSSKPQIFFSELMQICKQNTCDPGSNMEILEHRTLVDLLLHLGALLFFLSSKPQIFSQNWCKYVSRTLAIQAATWEWRGTEPWSTCDFSWMPLFFISKPQIFFSELMQICKRNTCHPGCNSKKKWKWRRSHLMRLLDTIYISGSSWFCCCMSF